MKSFLLVLFLLLSCVSDVQAKENPVQFSMRADEVLRGHFVQERNMKGFDRPLKSEGSFVISPSQGLIWNVTTPFPILTVITSDGLTQSIGGIKTMNMSAQKMPFVAQLYQMVGGVLTGNWTALQKEFTLAQSGTTQTWKMKLTPRKTDAPLQPFREIRVKGGRFVDEVVMAKPDGDSDVLSFSDVSLSQAPVNSDELAKFGLVAP